MVRILEYLDAEGESSFGQWFQRLDAIAAAKVTVAIGRLAAGNAGNAKSVGAGVFELKVDFGPGYRVYFGREADRFVILLGGGTKRRQHEDIEKAKLRWQAHRAKRRTGA